MAFLVLDTAGGGFLTISLMFRISVDLRGPLERRVDYVNDCCGLVYAQFGAHRMLLLETVSQTGICYADLLDDAFKSH